MPLVIVHEAPRLGCAWRKVVGPEGGEAGSGEIELHLEVAFLTNSWQAKAVRI